MGASAEAKFWRRGRGVGAGAPVPYSDRVVPLAWLNAIFVLANNLMALVYRNLINATLMSDKSARIKQELERLERARGRSVTSHASNKDYAAIGGIPHKHALLFNSLYLVQILMIARFVAVCLFLSSWPAKQLHVTCSKPSSSMLYESQHHYTTIPPLHHPPPLTITRGNNYSEEAYRTGSYMYDSGLTYGRHSRLECASYLEEVYEEKFGKFYVWNATQLLSSNQRAVSYLLLEQNLALQIQRKEVVVYNYLMGAMVATCGLFGCWLAASYPFEIPPLAFIFEPQFVSARVRLRLLRYLRLVRQSYKNFWSSFALDWRNELTYHAQSWWNSGSCGGGNGDYDSQSSSSGLDESDLSSSWSSGDDDEPGCEWARDDGREIAATLGHFESYMPTARRQSWRRVLIIIVPLSQSLHCMGLFSGILGLWLWFVYGSDVRTNRELGSFLSGRRELPPAASIESGGDRCRQMALATADQLRHAILSSYATTLGLDARPDPGRGPPQPTTTIILERLAPQDFPPLGHWLLPTAILALGSLMITLYLVAGILTIGDLCFWLVELRLKLNVCISLLRLQPPQDHQHLGQRQNQKQDKNQNQRKPRSPTLPNVPLLSRGGTGLVRLLFEPRPAIRVAGHELLRPQPRAKSRSSALEGNRARPESSQNRKQDSHMAQNDEESSPVESSTQICNFEVSEVGLFLLANRAQKDALSGQFARHLVESGWGTRPGVSAGTGTTSGLRSSQGAAERRATDQFLMSTYLDLRLFLDQIDDCRSSINVMIGFAVFHALNVIASSTKLDNIDSKIGFMVGGFMLGNLGLLAAAFFHSQCSKLYRPIHSVLALSTQGDKMTRHLALLWRRSLTDFTGVKSKSSFTVYSIRITYASALQFNLSLISLYILVLDKSRPGH